MLLVVSLPPFFIHPWEADSSLVDLCSSSLNSLSSFPKSKNRGFGKEEMAFSSYVFIVTSSRLYGHINAKIMLIFQLISIQLWPIASKRKRTIKKWAIGRYKKDVLLQGWTS